MKFKYIEWLGENFEVSTPKSLFTKVALWVGSVCLTVLAFRAISNLTLIPVWIVAIGWLVLEGSWTTSDKVTYQLLKNDSLRKGVAWIFIFVGSAYVLLGYSSLIMEVVNGLYWISMFIQHSMRRKGQD
jgi:hypothetical protein